MNNGNLKLLSFGKNFSNLITSVNCGLIGSEFSTFESRIKVGCTVVFTCDSQVWGTAKVSSDVFEDSNRVWKDKPYKYRAKIADISIFDTPFTFAECGADEIFRKELGNSWAFKILFTPGELPQEAVNLLQKKFKSCNVLDKKDFESYLDEKEKIISNKRKKKLGLKL